MRSRRAHGKLPAVASDFYSVGVPECVAAMAPTGCVQLFDVRDPANTKQVGTIPIAIRTAECVLDCSYLYGQAATIIDARNVLSGRAPRVVGNWIDELAEQGVNSQSCHHIREIRPGVILTACRPFAAISVNAADGGSPAHQVPPAGNGLYADGKPVAGALGCSVHWFQEHRSFHDGGLVAISEYEDGVRFLQVTPTGKIKEQGYFLSLGSSSSSPKWAGRGDVLYSIDYLRGIDILRWKGKHYVPGAAPETGRVGGTEGVTPPVAPNAAQAAQRVAPASQLQATGWSPLVCSLVERDRA